jgi:hypothetical protein
MKHHQEFCVLLCAFAPLRETKKDVVNLP